MEATDERYARRERGWYLLALYTRSPDLREHLPLRVQFKLRLHVRLRNLLLHHALLSGLPYHLQQQPGMGRKRPLQHLRDRYLTLTEPVGLQPFEVIS